MPGRSIASSSLFYLCDRPLSCNFLFYNSRIEFSFSFSIPAVWATTGRIVFNRPNERICHLLAENSSSWSQPVTAQLTDRWVMPMKIGPLARKRQINSSDREADINAAHLLSFWNRAAIRYDSCSSVTESSFESRLDEFADGSYIPDLFVEPWWAAEIHSFLLPLHGFQNPRLIRFLRDF